MALERWRFRRRSRLWRSLLTERLGEPMAARVVETAEREYAPMATEVRALPKGILNGALGGTYEFLAYGKAMQAEGCGDAEIGATFQEFHNRAIGRIPRWLLRTVGKIALPWLRHRLRKEATHTQGQPGESRAGASGWNYAYVEGKPGTAGFGIDVTGCPVCTLYARHDADDLVPHLCRLDDGISRALDLGLRRDGTRALGASHCDFRFQPGGEPRPLAGPDEREEHE